jgi:O-antigen/teichoic acid export membrane protein/glycosyltransferase involved in cell wall biosynthesis
VKSGTLFTNALSNSMLQFLQYIFPIVALPYLGNVVGPKFFGIVNFLGIIVGYFSLMVTYGFDISATREIARHANDRSKIHDLFNRVVSARLALFLAATLIFSILHLCLPEINHHTRAAYSSFLLVFGWVLMPNWYFQGLQKMHRIVPIHLVIKLGFVGLLFFVISRPEHYYRYPLILSLSTVAVGLLTFLVAVVQDRIPFRIKWDRPTWELLWKERFLFVTSIINNTYQTATIILLGLYLTFEEVGLFSLGWRLMNISQALIGIPLVFAMLPHATVGFQKSKTEGLQRVSRNLSVSVLALALSGTFMYLVSPWLVHGLFGPAYAASLGLFHLLLIVPFITGISATLSNQVLLNNGKDQTVLWITALGAVVSVTLNVALLPIWGMTGSALAIIATELVTLTLFWYTCQKQGYPISLAWFSPAEISSAVRLLWADFINRKREEFTPITASNECTLVVPTFNRPNVWPPLIDSLNALDLAPTRLIVVDQSTDPEARMLVQAYLKQLNSAIAVTYLPMDVQNRCIAKQTGFDHAPFGVVVVTDDDVTLPRDFFTYFKRFLTEFPDRVLTPRILEPGQAETTTSNVQRFTWYGHFYNNSHTWAQADGLNCYSGGAIGFIKSQRNAHFAYEPAYIGMGIHEETDFARQFLRAGYSISFRSEVTVMHYPQRNGNAFFKDRDPFPWYADSFYNFGMYHRKFNLVGFFLLRIPYMAFFGMYVGLFKYPGKRSARTAWYLGTQFIRGYRSWPQTNASKPAVFTSTPR